MDLSYIIPVYNVEKYLRRCVESIISQKNENYEIILIDDESTDNSGKICDELGEKYDTIKVIHQKNKGLSGARNTGIKVAKGRYILFVDSDDWIIDNTVEKVLEEADKFDLDVGVADFQYAYENEVICQNNEKPIHLFTPIRGKDFFLRSMKEHSSLMTVWKSIYKRSFLEENDLLFHEGYNHEDEEWTPRVYLKAQKVKDIQIVFYNYYIRCDSISQNPKTFEKNSLDMIHNCYRLKELSMNESAGELRDLIQDRIANLFLSAIYKGKLIYPRHREVTDPSFFKNMNLEKRTRRKVNLYKLNRYLYYYTNRFTKQFG